MAINDFDEKGRIRKKANEKFCTVTFEVLKEYITLKSPKKFKSTLNTSKRNSCSITVFSGRVMLFLIFYYYNH